MRTAELTESGRFRVVEKETPSIQSGMEVLIRIERAGICGSDMQYYTAGGIGDARVEYPYTMGHECAGSVADIGSRVTRVGVGDRIAVDPSVSCGQCDQCREGRVHTCRNIQFLGSPGELPGCMSDYIIMPESCCFPIGDSMSLEQAVIAEPLAIGIYSVKSGGALAGAKAAVLGAGPIGLSVLLAAKTAGAAKVYVSEKLPYRLEAALHAGADFGVNPDERDAAAVLNTIEKDQLDVVYECCGKQEALDQGVEMLKPGGKLVIVGIPKGDEVSFPIHRLRRKEITVVNVRRQCGCTREAIDLIASGGAAVDFMATHTFPLDEVAQGFNLVSTYGDGVIKAMIDLREGHQND